MKVPMNYNSLQKKKLTDQNGSALMMALFIMVILMLLGGAMMRVLSTGSEAVAQEVIGTRALAAANSAMQAELQQLFPLNSATNQCNANNSYDFTNINGLYHCTAVTTCMHYATYPPLPITTGDKFYRLKSVGTCQSVALASDSQDVVVSSRTLQIEARTL